MSRIVAVSNRVEGSRQKAAAGGLAIGLLRALEGGGGIWFGWNGEVSAGEPRDPEVRVRRGITYATIALDEALVEGYYNGFCNNTLWPLFHYRQGLSAYDRAQFEDAWMSATGGIVYVIHPASVPLPPSTGGNW